MSTGKKQLLRYVVLVAFLGACTSTTQPQLPGGPGGARPYTVIGTATDSLGRPIANAEVWLSPVGIADVAKGRTDASGRYDVAGLGNWAYTALAWTTVDYQGERYCVRLNMERASDFDAFNPAAGAVRNFQWTLTGTISAWDNQYVGGAIEPYFGNNFRGGKVELTLTPTGPLIDGSAGNALTFTIDPLTVPVYLWDVPVGPYMVSAVLLESGGGRTLLKLTTDTSVSFWDPDYEALPAETPFAFSSSGSCKYSDSGTNLGYLLIVSPHPW